MNKPTTSPLLFASVFVGLMLTAFIYRIKVNEGLKALRGLPIVDFAFITPDLFPFHHVVDQMEWITEFATNKTDFPSTNRPMIYYDRKYLYHPTTSDGCRYKCIFTNTTKNLSRGDVAVFSAQFSNDLGIALKNRGVLIAYETMESPVNAPIPYPAQQNQVDLFITYMAKSPVPAVYSIFIRNENPRYRFTAEETAQMLSKNCVHLLPPHHWKRKKLVAWAVSNHRASNNRFEFASAMAKFIPVGIYGREGKQIPPNVSAFHFLSLNYKFYLSFENSNCRNYITEKVYFNAMQHDMVPIVLGAFKDDYEGALPPHSYINVDDYMSIRELIEYLLYLDKNHTAYAAYFAWKEYGQILSHSRLDCRLCGFIHKLNAGAMGLPKHDAAEFLYSQSLCFYRPLAPIYPPSQRQAFVVQP